MSSVIEINLPIDEIEKRRERVTKAKNFQETDRIPVIPGIAHRFLIPKVGVSFNEYYTNPEIMLRTQILGQKWLMENIKTDAYSITGPWVGAWTDFQNTFESCSLGCKIVFPDNGTFSVFHSWDASQEVRDYSENGDGMWDNDTRYQAQFNRWVIYPDSVNLKVNYVEPPIMRIEISIPKRDYAGITLQPGDEFGLNIRYLNINHESNQWATTFDSYDFVNFVLGDYTPIGIEQETVADNFLLSQNYPNPFNPLTVIQYSIPYQTGVKLIIYNTLGQRIKVLTDQHQVPGNYEVLWDGTDSSGNQVSSGVYFYKIDAGKFHKTMKMLLVR